MTQPTLVSFGLHVPILSQPSAIPTAVSHKFEQNYDCALKTTNFFTLELYRFWSFRDKVSVCYPS